MKRTLPAAALLALLLSSCSVSTQWSLDVKKPIIEPWFAIEDLEGARIAVLPHLRRDSVTLDHPGLDDAVAESMRSGLGRGEIVRNQSSLSVLSIEEGLRLAREGDCAWLAVVHLLDMRQEQSTGEEVETDIDGNTSTETYFRSTTTVTARLEIYRSDGALGFHVAGEAAHETAEYDDESYGDFPNWLITWMFASADYPDYPDPKPVADYLVRNLIGKLYSSKK